jgi:CheY-like chemotaxis protein
MGVHAVTLWTKQGPGVVGIPGGEAQDLGPDAGPGRTHILLIESDDSNAELICEVLAEDGNYEIRSVPTAREAFQALGIGPDGEVAGPGWPANLILFDLTLLADDERKALRRTLDSNCKWPPMIMLSGWPTPYVESVLDRANTAGVITKPFDMETLLDSVHKVLRTQRDGR